MLHSSRKHAVGGQYDACRSRTGRCHTPTQIAAFRSAPPGGARPAAPLTSSPAAKAPKKQPQRSNDAGSPSASRPGARTNRSAKSQQVGPGRTRPNRSPSASEDEFLMGATYGGEEEDDAEVVAELWEQDGDEVIVDPEEVDRLVFGTKDFTAGTRGNAVSAADPTPASTPRVRLSPAQQQAATQESCREALIASGLPLSAPLVQLILAAVAEGLAPTEPAALVAASARLLDQVSELPPQAISTPTGPVPATQPDVGAAVRALQGLQAALGQPEPALSLVAGGALRVPGVLRLGHHDVRERMKALGPLTSIDPARLPAACCRHPEVLLAPLEEVKRKLTVLRNTTGLAGEAALDLVTPHMFSRL